MTRGRGCRASGLRRDQGRHAHGPCSVPTLLSSRSKDRTELESSDGHAEKTHPEYSEELEELCEQLRATLDGLVRARDPAPACSPSPSPGLAAPRAAVPAPDPGFSLRCAPPAPGPPVRSSSFVLLVLRVVRGSSTPCQAPQQVLPGLVGPSLCPASTQFLQERQHVGEWLSLCSSNASYVDTEI